MNVLRGALKGERERILTLAHQGEAMARTKTLKPLEHYLKVSKPKTARESGREVAAMLKGMAGRRDTKG